MKNETVLQILAAVLIVILGAALRLVPHPSNFSPIAALALFGGAVFGSKRFFGAGLLLPLAALVISDLAIGFHDLIPVVYGAFLLVGIVGLSIGRQASTRAIIGGSLLGSTFFFVTTNLAVWKTSGMYALSWEGLSQCFIAALPFFQNQIFGDLLFNAVLFSVWFGARVWIAKTANERA